MTAFVFGLSASSSFVWSMLKYSSSISTKTGTAPYCTIGATVVGKPAATVITSSPFFMRRSFRSGEISAKNASKFALLPLFTKNAHFTPSILANSFSNFLEYVPYVSQKSSELSTKFTISCSSKTLPA